MKDAPQYVSGHHKMKLWASEILLSCYMRKICIKFNNSKLNSLQSYDIAENYTVIQIGFSVCTNITPEFLAITIFRSFVKENDSNKNCKYI
jgi:hypothetical protein